MTTLEARLDDAVYERELAKAFERQASIERSREAHKAKERTYEEFSDAYTKGEIARLDAEEEAYALDRRFNADRERARTSKANLVRSLERFKPRNRMQNAYHGLVVLLGLANLSLANEKKPQPAVEFESVPLAEQTYSMLEEGQGKTWPFVSMDGEASRVTSITGLRKLEAGEVGSRYHKSVDGAMDIGDRFISPADGTVERVDKNNYIVEVATGRGLTHRFYHIDPRVNVGQRVSERDTLGSLTQRSLAFHLGPLTGYYPPHGDWRVIATGGIYTPLIGETIDPLSTLRKPLREHLAESADPSVTGFRYLEGATRAEKIAHRCKQLYRKIADQFTYQK